LLRLSRAAFHSNRLARATEKEANVCVRLRSRSQLRNKSLDEG
jgi:hypothetical protein